MKGYKVFNPDWTCHGFKYEVGKTYEMDGDIVLCGRGFHFCTELIDCFSYYEFDPENKVAEVEALGEIIKSEHDSKCVTNKIKIVREIDWEEAYKMVNIGNDNKGVGNIGSYNKGNFNVGSYNYGEYNTGDHNYGDNNAGHYNTEDRNLGNYNKGRFNVGSYNIGIGNIGYNNYGDFNVGCDNIGDFNTGNNNIANYCTGDFNLVDYSTGYFCTEKPTVKFFDRDSNLTLADWHKHPACILLSDVHFTKFIKEQDMTEEEKCKYPTYKVIGGYIKKLDPKEAFREWWNKLPDHYREQAKYIIKTIPNFDPEKFKLITGIDVTQEELK